MFLFRRVILYTVSMNFLLPKALAKNPAKDLGNRFGKTTDSGILITVHEMNAMPLQSCATMRSLCACAQQLRTRRTMFVSTAVHEASESNTIKNTSKLSKLTILEVDLSGPSRRSEQDLRCASHRSGRELDVGLACVVGEAKCTRLQRPKENMSASRKRSCHREYR